MEDERKLTWIEKRIIKRELKKWKKKIEEDKKIKKDNDIKKIPLIDAIIDLNEAGLKIELDNGEEVTRQNLQELNKEQLLEIMEDVIKAVEERI